MLHRRFTAAALAAASMTLAGATASPALAAADPAPSFSRCPIANASVVTCTVITSTDGAMKIRNTMVPIGTSIKLEGGLAVNPSTGNSDFVQPTSGTALTAQPVDVPGGLLGIPLPLGFDKVKATAQQAGTPKIDIYNGTASLPIKVKLDNPLLGSGCTIGSSLFPIRLNLIPGTTSPPPPNTPITGKMGTFVPVDAYTGELQGNVRVDNAFSVPIALNCGYLTGILVTTAVNLKLGLPSPAGYNSMTQVDNAFFKAADDVRAGR